jgi:hypothetical protein
LRFAFARFSLFLSDLTLPRFPRARARFSAFFSAATRLPAFFTAPFAASQSVSRNTSTIPGEVVPVPTPLAPTAKRYVWPAVASKRARSPCLLPPHDEMRAGTLVSAVTASPVYTRTSELASGWVLQVWTVKGPARGAVHLHQTEAPPWSSGSNCWSEAKTFEPVARAGAPVSSSASARLSFASDLRSFRTMLGLVVPLPTPSDPTAMKYVCPAAASKTAAGS